MYLDNLLYNSSNLLKCRVEESFDCYDKDEKKLLSIEAQLIDYTVI